MLRGITAPVLEPTEDAKVALQSVNVEAVMENLLCEVTVRQVYHNLEKINIEAVYTFSLPLNAVLLDMTIKTRTKELKGVVIEKSEAEDKYEDAVTEGDTAIMLEQIEPGLYTMNVGNLQPEDEIKISITYAELYKWRHNSLRFFMPTTIAPRYGDPENVGIQPHQTPEYDLMTDNPFKITLTVLGHLANASFQSPSHGLLITKHPEKTVISLKQGEALMDRDFVLNILLESEKKSFALFDRDIDGYIALASFYPKFPDVKEEAPRCITIIVDCSGSMGGDSIAQARKALYEILELLRPEDFFNVIRFGNACKMLFTAPLKAEAGNLKKAKNLLEILDADMGGTEIGQAVATVIKSQVPNGISKEVLLITDGEVYEWEKLTAEAAKSGLRFFTVGVGSSVSEAFVQTLAEVTGGACELVSPREDMSEKVVRHFKRIYFPKAENVTINWPCKPVKMFPEQVNTLYDGDRLHVFAQFRDRPAGNVMLTAKLENGETLTQSLPVHQASYSKNKDDLPCTIARMAAASEIRTLISAEETAQIAVKYQLMSRHTNYLAIDVKADGKKAQALPALRKTPQMLAAGWGGTGAMVSESRVEYMDIPVFSKRHAPEPIKLFSTISLDEVKRRHIINFIHAMNRLHSGFFHRALAVASLQDMEAHGVPEDIIEDLTELKESGIEEYVIMVVFLYLLTQQKRFKEAMSRTLRRIITKAYKQLPEFQNEIAQKIEGIIVLP